MIPTVSAPGAAPPSTSPQAAQKTAQPQPEAPRSSAGEVANTALRAETARAIDAPAQSSIAARLSEQETKERPDSVFDDLVGPAPTFEESLLERQARVALDPPEIKAPPPETVESKEADGDVAEIAEPSAAEPPVFEDPPPTPTEKAEASFAETRTLSDEPKFATIDVAR